MVSDGTVEVGRCSADAIAGPVWAAWSSRGSAREGGALSDGSLLFLADERAQPAGAAGGLTGQEARETEPNLTGSAPRD